jgi:hypothetical protein
LTPNSEKYALGWTAIEQNTDPDREQQYREGAVQPGWLEYYRSAGK